MIFNKENEMKDGIKNALALSKDAQMLSQNLFSPFVSIFLFLSISFSDLSGKFLNK